ncbi:hypothetical protein C3L33_10886, partial [Rhododendron williamsianum]
QLWLWTTTSLTLLFFSPSSSSSSRTPPPQKQETTARSLPSPRNRPPPPRKNSPHEALSRLSSKHGPILFLRFGSRPTLVLSSPSAVEECFARNDVAFANRPPGVAADTLTYNTPPTCGPRTATSGGPSAASPSSSSSPPKASRNRPSSAKRRRGTSLPSGVVNGERFVGDEDAGGEAGRKLVEGFEETFMRGKPLNLCDYFPVLRWVDYQGVEKSMRAVQGRRDGFLQGLVDEFRRKREENCVDVGDEYKSSTMIGTLLRLQESEPEFYTEDVIKSVILVLFLGGIGTSMSTMERAISLLLNHPEALRKARTEIDTQVGHSRLLDETDLAALPFLHCVICETLRELENLSKKYGPILALRFGSHPVLILSSPSAVEELFSKNDLIFANRPRFLVGKLLNYNYTTLGASSYGDHWRNLRRLTALEIFSTAKLNAFLGIRQEEVRSLLKTLFRDSPKGFVKVEMKSRLSELSFNIIMRMVAGKRYFGVEVEDSEEAREFRLLIRDIFELSGASNPGDFVPFLRWIDFGKMEKKMLRVQKKMDAFLQGLIEEKRREDDEKVSLTEKSEP